jgi:hypothetical protein
VLNANNCLAKDSIRLNVSEQEIEANFLLQSEAWVGDTLVMIEISWPVPESIEWDCPAGLYILREEGPELEFIALQQGYFDIGLDHLQRYLYRNPPAKPCRCIRRIKNLPKQKVAIQKSSNRLL